MKKRLWIAIALISGCGGGGGDGGSSGVGGGADSGLTLVSVFPSDGATAVEPDTEIQVEFSGDVDPATIDETTFVLEGPVGPIDGTRRTTGRTAVFIPTRRLSLAAKYEVRWGKSPVSRFTTRDGLWRSATIVAPMLRDPRVAMDADGNAMTAWIGEAGDIFFRRYLVKSGWQDSGFVRVGAPYPAQLSLVGAPNGGFWAAWIESYQNPNLQWTSQAYVSRFIPELGWDTPFAVLSANGDLDVALDAQGRALVVAQYNGAVLSRLFVPETGWQTPRVLASQISGLQGLTARMDVVSGVHVVWTQAVESLLEIRGVRSGDLGDWSVPVALNSPSESIHPPMLACSPSGGAMVVWTQRSSGTYRLFFNRYDPETGWAGPQRTHPSDQTETLWPSVAGNPDKQLILVAERGSQIWSSTYTPGSGWEAPIPVSQYKSCKPLVGIDAGGNAIAVWARKVSLYENDLWSSRRTFNGGWSPGQGLETAVGEVSWKNMAVGETGAATVVWSESLWSDLSSSKSFLKRFD